MTRRRLDLYETGAELVGILLSRYGGIGQAILEPCAGPGAIARVLTERRYAVHTNDIDPTHRADMHLDAATMRVPPGVGTVVTNPPFNRASAILRNFLGQGVDVAFLLRLSFLEPTEDRLDLPPPKAMIVCPRYSFTEDGRTDSVTCAWMLWGRFDPRIEIATEAKRRRKR